MPLLALLILLAQSPGQPEPFPFEPADEALSQRAYGLVMKGKLKEARPLAERLTRDDPKNPRGWRMLGLIEMELRDPKAAEDLTRALDLGLDDARKPEVYAGRARHWLGLDRLDDADQDAREALRLNPRSPLALEVAQNVALYQKRYLEALDDADRLLEVNPAAASPHLVRAVALANADALEAAGEEAAQAREAGLSDEVLDRIEDDATTARWTRRAWQVPLAGAGFLALSLLLLFVAGSALSRVEVAALSSVRGALLREEQTRGERWVGRLYNGVLWYGTALFYLSVPLMLVLTLACGPGLIWALLAFLPRIPIQLIGILLIAAVGGVVAILRGLFLRVRPDEGERVLSEADEPRLFAVLREAAEVAQSRPVARVHLEPDATVGVREAGGAFRVLLGGGERVLHLGLAAVRGLTVSELKAFLAHEYGHFSHGETRLSPIVGRMKGSVIVILRQMDALGVSGAINPVYWYLRLYLFVFDAVSAGHSRRRELLADRAAALAYGGDVFGRALAKVVESGDLFGRGAVALYVSLREAGRRCKDLYGLLDAAFQATPPRLRALRAKERLEAPPGKLDSHPPPADRIRRVAGIEPALPAEPEPASSLFADHARLARELSGALVQRIEMALGDRGVELPPVVEGDPSSEHELAVAISAYEDALELRRRVGPEEDGLIAPALARLEGAVGADHPFLVSALVDYSQAKAQGGDRPAAAAALQRAIGILEARPKAQRRRIDALKQLLENVRAPAA